MMYYAMELSNTRLVPFEVALALEATEPGRVPSFRSSPSSGRVRRFEPRCKVARLQGERPLEL